MNALTTFSMVEMDLTISSLIGSRILPTSRPCLPTMPSIDWSKRIQVSSCRLILILPHALVSDEVTIIALAPLTNLALALKTDPSVAANIKDIFIMGGNVEGVGNVSTTAEFNFFADPEAAYTVLDCVECPTFIISWEMCWKYVKPDMVST